MTGVGTSGWLELEACAKLNIAGASYRLSPRQKSDALIKITPSRAARLSVLRTDRSHLMLSRRPRSFLSALLVLSLLLAALGASKADTPPAQANQASTQAQTALKQGLSLLRRNRADQALPLFESALKEFTDAGDQVGAAATHDALGDVYLRQGQYELALPHNETANANLMYAKLGEAFYLAGREEDARAAFAKIIEQGKNRQGAGAIVETSAGGDGNHNKKGGAGGAVTFATISAALLPSLNCAAFKNPHN